MTTSHIPILIKDSKDVMNVLVQINVKKGIVGVISGFTPLENLILLIEGLGMTIERCCDDGMDRKEVFKVMNTYLIKCIGNYEKMDENK
jgi:hypothetical protein